MITVFLVVLVLSVCVLSFIIINIDERDLVKNTSVTDLSNSLNTEIVDNKENNSDVDKSFNLINNNLFGVYTVKNDKKSFISITDDGSYSLTINKCDGYLTLEGTYEIRDKKLILNNSNVISDIDTLNNNENIDFQIIDSNSIVLSEDIACLYQNTLFERLDV